MPGARSPVVPVDATLHMYLHDGDDGSCIVCYETVHAVHDPQYKQLRAGCELATSRYLASSRY